MKNFKCRRHLKCLLKISNPFDQKAEWRDWGGFDDADGLSVCRLDMRVYYVAHPGEFVVEISADRFRGGEHIRMIVTEAGAKIEYDCALGTIDEALLLDEDNNFEAQGTHVYERGGPIRLGEPPPTVFCPVSRHGGRHSNAPYRDIA